MDKWLVRFRGETIPYSPRLHERATPAKNQRLPDVWLGFDSEAADAEDGFPEVQTFQTYNGLDPARLEYVKPGDAFRHFWSIIIRSIPEDLFRPEKNRLLLVPIYCHNWEYDWGMIVKESPEGWRNQSKMNVFFAGFTDTVSVERTTYKVRVEGGHMLGNAPTLTVVVSRKGRAVRLRFLDTFPFFPKALSTVAKDIGLEKGDRASVIGIDWRKLKKSAVVTTQNEAGETVTVSKKDFEQYGRHDPVLVWELGKRIRQMHEVEGLTSLAVSGAGYSAKVMLANLDCPFSGSLGGKPAVQIALDAFHGGRSGRLAHGRIAGASIYDFRSSYPSIQTRLPALFSDVTMVFKFADLEVTEFMRLAKMYHGFARIDGIESDTAYPSLLSADAKGSIRPIVGAFEDAPATAAEIYMGVMFGGLHVTNVREAVFYAPKDECGDKRPFASFIMRAWMRKNSHAKGTIEYDAAKIQANSGYGKMIEHRGAQIFVMDSIMVPLRKGGEEGEQEVRNHFLSVHPDYWHDSLYEWSSQTEIVAGYINLADLIKAKPEFGFYACPQYASWITGHAHARLVIMMRLFESVKWDTDSATTLLSEAEIARRIAAFPVADLPDYIQPLSIGDDLGELDMEGRNMAGVILGNKRYYLEGEVLKGGKWIPGIKEGHHGLPGIRKDDIKRVLLEYQQDSNTYIAKPRPVKTKGARTWRQVGHFQSKKYKPSFEPNGLQDFREGGGYLPFSGFRNEG